MSNFNNPYASPVAMPQTLGRQYQLAGLDKRFLGALFDGLVGLVAVVPGLAFLIADRVQSNGQGELGTLGFIGIGLSIVALIILTVLQLYLLVTRSQTIGKYLIKTQIVDIATNQPAGFVKTFVLRSFVSGLIGGVPMIGGIYAIVDIVFIFRQDRRCIHDLIAGTVVVDIA